MLKFISLPKPFVVLNLLFGVFLFAQCGNDNPIKGEEPSVQEPTSSLEHQVVDRQRERLVVEQAKEPSKEAVSDDGEPTILDGGIAEEPNTSLKEAVINPLEGFDPDAGIPPDYNWGKPGKGFAKKIISFKPKGGASHGSDRFPEIIQGPPKGSGDAKGSFDVLSLGCGGSIILEFSSPLIANGPGPDFIIFENAFIMGTQTWAEPAQVSVSLDGKRWYSFPCAPDKTGWPYPQCAGVNPVYSNPNNKKKPNDPKAAGGDAFDLEKLGLSYVRFIKIEDKTNLMPNSQMACSGPSGGFDLDAISVIWGFQP